MKIFKIAIYILTPILSIFLFIALYRMSIGKSPFVSMSQFITYAKTLDVWSPYSNFIEDVNSASSSFKKIYDTIQGSINGSVGLVEAFTTSISNIFSGVFKVLTLPFAFIYDLVKLMGSIFSIFYEFLIFCNM